MLGAAASILNTSGINMTEGGRFQLRYDLGHSAANNRVSTSTAISVTSGFLEVIGNAGVVRQSLGTVNAGGLTTILADTNGAGSGTPGAATEVTIANLVRGAGATVTFAGPNLGGAPVVVDLGAAQGNVLLKQINTAAPSAALVGGAGGVDTSTISILPWALGDTANAAYNSGAGTGFVTYGANGVRLLDTTTEYNFTNNFTTVGVTDNMRVTGTITSHAEPKTVNSLFFASNGRTLAGGANTLTVTSGALASNVAVATISNAVNFGSGGAGRGRRQRGGRACRHHEQPHAQRRLHRGFAHKIGPRRSYHQHGQSHDQRRHHHQWRRDQRGRHEPSRWRDQHHVQWLLAGREPRWVEFHPRLRHTDAQHGHHQQWRHRQRLT